MSLTVGSLFAGIGGFDLGLERAGMQVKWQVENNKYCQRVLAKHWPQVPRYGDIREIAWGTVEPVDLVCGGFPCQPFSVAGKRRGTADDRYLWPEVVRCLDALRPTWFLGENVPGIINLALDQVCTDLESLGYTVWPVCLPACAVDAPHRRQRVWIVAHPISADGGEKRGVSEFAANQGRRTLEIGGACLQSSNGQACAENIEPSREDVAYAEKLRLERRWDESEGNRPGRSEIKLVGRSSTRDSGWLPEPSVGRVAHGIPHRVDRLRGLGNAVVPQIPEILGNMIVKAMR